MEETKWLTKGKIITFVVIVLIVIGIITGVLIHRNNLKKDYIKYEKQLEYAAPNYLLKEKIKLYEYEWREINVTDILKQKLVINKKSSDCSGYVIAEALKDDTLDLEESTSNVSEDNNDASTTESSSDKENKTNKRVSSNIKYKEAVLNLSKYQINTSAQIDDAIPGFLALIIDECFNDYKIKELIGSEDEYINSERESEIRKGLTSLVTQRISNAALDKLSLFYNISEIAEILADKIYITVMNYVIEHNTKFSNQ